MNLRKTKDDNLRHDKRHASSGESTLLVASLERKWQLSQDAILPDPFLVGLLPVNWADTFCTGSGEPALLSFSRSEIIPPRYLLLATALNSSSDLIRSTGILSHPRLPPEHVPFSFSFSLLIHSSLLP